MIGRNELSKLVYNLLCAICFVFIHQALAQTVSTPETKITVTAPLNPVREGDMLSIMCKITNLENGDSVMIQRTVRGETEKISYDGTMHSSVDNRFFLANRRLTSGVMVYFLSVIDVTRENDEGEYECKVVQETNNIIIKSIAARVQYFPSEGSVQCSSDVVEVVTSGSQISFNCASEDGLPEVDITWAASSGASDKFQYTHERRNGMVYSNMTLQASMRYNGVVFTCMISSSAFDTERRCHVGPITVKRNPLNPDEPEYEPEETDRTNSGGIDDGYISDPEDSGIVRRPDTEVTTTDCASICASQSQTTFYWIVATVVAGILAFLFLFIGIGIAVKLCNMQKAPPHRDVQHIGQIMFRQPLEDVYERIECGNRNDDRMYMSLHGLRKPDNLVVQTNIPAEIEDNYTRTPTATIQIVNPGVLPDGGTFTHTSNAFTAGMEANYTRTPTTITSDNVDVAGQVQ